MKENILITVLLIALFTGIGFFAGTKYQQNQKPTGLGQFGNGQGGNRMGGNAGGQNGGRRMGGQIMGDITAADDKSITVKTTDGSSKIVLLVDSTTINKASTALKSDLKVGEKVAVFGTTTTDGSVTAQNIQLNPIVRERPTVEPTK
jgi:hypothetical protein